jgi:hypothetical protein
MKPVYIDRFTAGLALVLAAACSDSMGLEGSRRALGIFQLENGPPATGHARDPDPDPAIRWNVPPTTGVAFPPSVIEAPDTVFAGQSFVINVNTIGPSGCWQADAVDLTQAGPLIQLTPWDRHSGAGVCTTITSYLSHTAILTLEQAGAWTIRASGRRVRGENEAEVAVTAERTVYVRPAS